MNNQTKRKLSVTGVLLTAFMFVMALLPAPVLAEGNVPVTVDIKVTYKVNGNTGAAGGDRFTLTADDAVAPMPEGSAGGKRTITIPDEGSYSFGDIRFERPDVFWYTPVIVIVISSPLWSTTCSQPPLIFGFISKSVKALLCSGQ